MIIMLRANDTIGVDKMNKRIIKRRNGINYVLEADDTAGDFMNPISKVDAKILTLKFYSTGLPCKNGHNAKRLVSTGTCVVCDRERKFEWRQRNLKEVVKKQKLYKDASTSKSKRRVKQIYNETLQIIIGD
jgi:hypothetical protein